jgi:hypothetical protein
MRVRHRQAGCRRLRGTAGGAGRDQTASVQFSGLAPGLVGVYEVNVAMPAGAMAARALFRFKHPVTLPGTMPASRM